MGWIQVNFPVDTRHKKNYTKSDLIFPPPSGILSMRDPVSPSKRILGGHFKLLGSLENFTP